MAIFLFVTPLLLVFVFLYVLYLIGRSREEIIAAVDALEEK